MGPGGRAAARRRAGQRQVPQRAARDDHARPVEDLPPGRDRRRLRAGRLLPLQRPLRRADLRDPAAVAARGVQLPRPRAAWRASCWRSPRSTSPRSAATCPTTRGADGQHGGVEAVGEGRAQQRGGDAGPRGGRPAARRDQPGARLRRGRRRPGAGRTSSSPVSASPDRPRCSATCGRRSANNIDRYRSYPRIVGETGGKNAVVAHPSADPDALLVALVRGAFEYQGQKCSAASRAYLPRSLWKELEGRLADTVGQLEVGDSTRHETFVGAVIDETALRRLESTIDPAKDLPGHRILTGGTVRPESGWFVDPTVVRHRRPDVVPDAEGVLRTAADRARLRRRRLGQGAAPGRHHQRVRPHLLDLRQRPRRRSAPRSTPCATPPA